MPGKGILFYDLCTVNVYFSYRLNVSSHKLLTLGFPRICHHCSCLNKAGWLLSWKLWVSRAVISATHKCIQPACPSAGLVTPSRTHWGTLSLQARTIALELPPNRTLHDQTQTISSDHHSHCEMEISVAEWSWIFWFINKWKKLTVYTEFYGQFGHNTFYPFAMFNKKGPSHCSSILVLNFPITDDQLLRINGEKNP